MAFVVIGSITIKKKDYEDGNITYPGDLFRRF